MGSNRAAKENEPVPPNVRKDVLERDDHECQFCGRSEGDAGGFLQLEVHHKDQNPDGRYHDLDNLQTLCVDCHRWMHLKPDPEEVPITLSDADKQHLRAHDYEILRVVAKKGPLTVADIRDALSVDLSAQSIRERLRVLMGLDSRTGREQLLDQNVSGQWGLPKDIVHSERGRIPPSIDALIQRVEDERVREAVDRGISRQAIADTFGIGRRATYYRENRARAYQFPLDEVTSNRGRPTRVDPDERNAIPNGNAAQLRVIPIKTDQTETTATEGYDDKSSGDGDTDCSGGSSRDGSDDRIAAE